MTGQSHSADAATTRAWIEVDLGALLRNGQRLASHAGVPLLPMVKADAYGLGVRPVVRTLERSSRGATASPRWRKGPSCAPSGFAPGGRLHAVAPRRLARGRGADLTLALHRADEIRDWGGAGRPWHLAIDTGMNRAGVPWDEVGPLGDALRATPPSGVFTHFHSAEAVTVRGGSRRSVFAPRSPRLPAVPPLVHTENSPAIEHGAGRSGNSLVRPGVFLYGVETGGDPPADPVVSVRARVVDVRAIAAGESVSYGATWRAAAPARIATLSVGYADGYRRAFGNRAEVLLHGRPAPVVGMVTMDMTMVDVTDLPCAVGDVATLLGADGDRRLSLATLADAGGLSPYEVLTGFRGRLERRYLGRRLARRVSRRAIILVLDGVGAGEAPDADAYGDQGSDTLGHVADAVGGLRLPALETMGLGLVRPLRGLRDDVAPSAAHGLMNPSAAGKDSTTGHWELAGVRVTRPFPTYPAGFPADVLEAFSSRTGRPVIGNVVGSGTDVLTRFGAEHQRTGAWIVYTSADSVFQVAAHEEVVPLEELYAACAAAREQLVPPHDVSRVIARPFVGEPGAWRRTANRRDFSLAPPATTLLDALAEAGVARAGVGKVDDLFAGAEPLVDPHDVQRRGDPARRRVAPERARWVALRQPSRFRPAVRPPQRRRGVRRSVAGVRCRAARRCSLSVARTMCSASPPTMATIRRPPAPITRASACRCWSMATACAR